MSFSFLRLILPPTSLPLFKKPLQNKQIPVDELYIESPQHIIIGCRGQLGGSAD